MTQEEKIKQYVNARDNAVIECWKTNSIKPLNDFIKHSGNNPLGWDDASNIVKWLTLCNLTMDITNPELAVYRDKAKQLKIDIRNGKCIK